MIRILKCSDTECALLTSPSCFHIPSVYCNPNKTTINFTFQKVIVHFRLSILLSPRFLLLLAVYKTPVWLICVCTPICHSSLPWSAPCESDLKTSDHCGLLALWHQKAKWRREYRLWCLFSCYLLLAYSKKGCVSLSRYLWLAVFLPYP